jgi:guanylate kinase
MPDALLVFLAPPSFDELARRLIGRGTEDDERVRKRLDLARIEMASEDEFDVVVVNDTIPAAADRVVALLVEPPS